jgi:hypothetical protein
LPDKTGPFITAFQATKGGALYAIIVFVIGFILGTIRVSLVVPRLGKTIAVIMEAPIMLAAIGSSAAGAWTGSMYGDRSRLGQ